MNNTWLGEKDCLWGKNCFVSPKAVITGQVVLGERSSVWPQAVLRGDLNRIIVGHETNVQENVVIHVSSDCDVQVGYRVTIGHGAIVHGCHIGNCCLIGMHATLMDGAKIGDYCIVGAQTLIPQHKTIPPYSLVLGNPGRIVRTLTEKDVQLIEESAQVYLDLLKCA